MKQHSKKQHVCCVPNEYCRGEIELKLGNKVLKVHKSEKSVRKCVHNYVDNIMNKE